jgi:uncharacterized membrane protein YdjX (TVP38/TMEM64 family)
MKKPMLGVFFLCLAVGLFLLSRDYLNLEYLKMNFLKFQNFQAQDETQFFFTFFLLYVAVIACSIPGSIFLSLAAGAFYGPTGGVLLASFAGALGATLAFLSSRYLLGGWARQKYATVFQKIDSRFHKQGAFYLVSLRLIATVPFSVVNISMGLTTISVGAFYLFTQVAMLPLTFIYVQAGVEISKMNRLEDLISVRLIGLLTLLAFVPWILKSIYTRFVGKKRKEC